MPGPLKVGLIGAGRIAHAHLAAYLEHSDRVRLTAVCDVVEAAAQAFAKRAGGAAVYTDFERMLKEADVDAIDICTVHDQHPAQAIAAARAGKHVLAEKAMAHTLRACRDMIEAADEAGVILMIGQNLRYSRDAAAVKRMIEEGRLGRIHAARTHFVFRATRYNLSGHWMNDGNRAGGGILMTNSIHHIDLLRYYLGNVARVTGICRALQPEMVNGAEDLVAATLEFENGAIGDLFASWTTSRAPETSYYIVFGSEGTLYSTPPQSEAEAINQFGPILVSLEASDPPGACAPFAPLEPAAHDLPSDDLFVNEILHFADCCRSGREPITSGKDNIETIKVIMGIYESARSGCAVKLRDL